MVFDIVLFTASLVAGAIAAISGFGIGSILTPVLSTQIDTRLAVAVVSIPHFIGPFVRFVRLRKYVNRRVAFTFGVASAIGGLGGAVLNAYVAGPTLGYILGALLVFAGLSGISGFADRLQLRGRLSWIGGFISAALGGLVGNQGGIRSAAMLGFHLTKESFVATATAIALVVDGARVPVYLVSQPEGMLNLWPIVCLSTVGVVAGTFAGSRLLKRIPEGTFKWTVSALVLGLGIFMLFRPLSR
jgi:uncharacterized membrane protein YfcA